MRSAENQQQGKEPNRFMRKDFRFCFFHSL
jgi:hypothetical protein